VVLLSGIKHLLYEEGYTIKSVQRLFKEHGNGFVLAVGRGGAPAELLAERQSANAQAAHMAQGAVPAPHIVAAPAETETEQQSTEEVPEGIRTDTPSGMMGFARSVLPNIGGGEALPFQGLSAAERKKLQGALFELLECKRILDQARLN